MKKNRAPCAPPRHPAEIILEWIAHYVTNIHEQPARRGCNRVEIIVYDAGNDRFELIARTAKTRLDALKACCLAGLRKFPLPDAR